MASTNTEEEWNKVKSWAEKILKGREEGKKKSVDKITTLKHIALIVVIALMALALIYIIYRAYTVPEPKSLEQEVSEMIEQNQKLYYENHHNSVVGAGIYT